MSVHPTRRALLLALPLWALACTDYSMDKADGAYARDTGVDEATAMDGQVVQLRVDVVPPSTAGVMAQSVLFDLDTVTASDLSVELQPTRVLSGEVRGFVATPYLGEVEVPGQSAVAVPATVTVAQPLSLARASITSEDGVFTLEVPGASDHVLAVVPEDGQRLPFLAIDPFSLTRDRSGQVFELGSGYPVYGTLTQDDGSGPLGTAQVWLEDLLTGVAGPKVDVERDGHFLVRALPGSYRLVAAGDSRSPTPRVTAEVDVWETEDGEPGEAVRVDLALGTLEAARTSGRVLDAGGAPLYQATLRFTSQALDDAAGVLVLEEDTPTHGEFQVDLLPGLWQIEVIPPYESSGDNAPLLLDAVEVGPGGLELGDLQVPERVAFTGRVVGDGDSGVANVAVVAREAGFDHYVYTTLTDGDGHYSFRVPDVALEVAFMPSSPKHTVTWREYPGDLSRGERVRLEDGSRVSGTVTGPGGVVAGALVELKDAATDRTYGTAITDPDGRFAVRVALGTDGGWAGADAPDTGFAD